jgi:predicted transcriptional regulator
MNYRDTQLSSWEDLQDSLGARQMKVFSVIKARKKGLTSVEVAKIMKVPINCVVGRITELNNKGLVLDSGRRALNPDSGRKIIVWEAKNDQ